MAKDMYTSTAPNKEPDRDASISKSVHAPPKKVKPRPRARESFEEPPLKEAVFTYIGYGLLTIIGYVCDFLRLVGLKKEGHSLQNVSSWLMFIKFSKCE